MFIIKMTKKPTDNTVYLDDDQELKLDEEFKIEAKQEVEQIMDEDHSLRMSMNTYTDIRVYLDKMCLGDELGINLTIDLIRDNLF